MIEDIGARHKPTEFPIRVTQYCTFCGQAWPCDAAEALAKLDAVKNEHIHPYTALTGHLCRVCAIVRGE